LIHHRDLEWRRTRDPYAIWVSEVMLQQTRVDTVKAYWTPFMQKFPDVATLAAADEQQVLAAWSGLGYYRRARLLHRGAQHVHAQLGGQLPRTPEGLREIPGIGRYTAGAIASIAHDTPHALVDGNVARVLSRLQAVTDPKQQDAGAAGHWQRAQQIVEAGSPRVLAQALMELGATVCTPQLPRCNECPLRSHCAAFARGLVDKIPAPKQRAPSPQQDLWALGLRRAGRLLLTRRPAEGLLAGMWCLPVIERPPAPDDAPYGGLFDRTRVTPAAIRKAVGLKVTKVAPLSEPIKHVFTHRVWILWPCRADVDLADGSGQALGEAAWIAPGERPVGGIPTLTEKLLERLGY
jgi:A/G-specific adenine glycosylase